MSHTRWLTVLLPAVAALALLSACGTATSAPTAAAPTTSSTVSPTATPSPTTEQTTPTATPTAARVLVPLVLPAGGSRVSGDITGVVTLGLNRCLFLRTDAGQRFELTGVLADHLRTLLVGRMVPLEVRPRTSPPATLSATVGVRIDASGSVHTGASVCSTPYSFSVTGGSVDSSVGALH